MNIEKINDNKIKIEFDEKFLEENQISLHSFLSNPLLCNKLINTLLEKNKNQLHISYENEKIDTQLYYINKQTFIINITNFVINDNKTFSQHKSLNSDYLIYSFSSITNFKQFLNFINHIPLLTKNIHFDVYTFQNTIFLLIHTQNINHDNYNKIQYILLEFSDTISYSENLAYKIQEYGTIIKN